MEDLLVFDGLNDLLEEGVLASRTFLGELFAFAEGHGIEGNIWQHYLTYRLLREENVFTLAAERGMASGTLCELVKSDMEIIADYFDPAYVESVCPIGGDLAGYVPMEKHSSPFSRRIRGLTAVLCECQTPQQYLDALLAEYAARGAGLISTSDAFSFTLAPSGRVVLYPVVAADRRGLGRLVGYEQQKQAILSNTAAFLEGRGHNDVLVYGDAGTGKSTAVKALSNAFLGKKLKLIEVYREQYKYLPLLIDHLYSRAFHFILFLDDLSFEEDENDYKHLKAFLEGGVRRRPAHIAVYATSNRRHLLVEKFSDKNDITYTDDLHRSETVEEKLSLSARFGLRIFFGAPKPEELIEIVKSLRDRENLEMEDGELLRELNRWTREAGNRSGRTAEQFVQYLLSRTKREGE